MWPPEGINIPGDWNGWSNYPAPGPFLSSIHAGGTNVLITEGTRRYSTTFQASVTSSSFLFTSGPSGSPWNNKWCGVNVSLNAIQNYLYQNSRSEFHNDTKFQRWGWLGENDKSHEIL